MQKFNYEALDKSGLEQVGEIECADEPDAVNRLRERGLFVTKIGRDGEPGFFEVTLRASPESGQGSIKPVPPSPNGTEEEIVALTSRLLTAIDHQDWNTYCELCDGTLTAFEPEARGQLVEGLDFHQFYFELHTSTKRQSTLTSPQVRVLKDAAVITYGRVVQLTDSLGARTAVFEETRVWERVNGSWKNVHFHRSEPGS